MEEKVTALITEYQIGKLKYSSHVVGFYYPDEVQTILTRRGIGEKFLGLGEVPVQQIPFENMQICTHALCFAGWVAISQGTATPNTILSDSGIIHQYAHFIGEVPDGLTKETLIKRMNQLFKSVKMAVKVF